MQLPIWKFFELSVRFFAVLFGMSINMRRIISYDATFVDDFMFFSSVILGIILGRVWIHYESGK